MEKKRRRKKRPALVQSALSTHRENQFPGPNRSERGSYRVRLYRVAHQCAARPPRSSLSAAPREPVAAAGSITFITRAIGALTRKAIRTRAGLITRGPGSPCRLSACTYIYTAHDARLEGVNSTAPSSIGHRLKLPHRLLESGMMPRRAGGIQWCGGKTDAVMTVEMRRWDRVRGEAMPRRGNGDLCLDCEGVVKSALAQFGINNRVLKYGDCPARFIG